MQRFFADDGSEGRQEGCGSDPDPLFEKKRVKLRSLLVFNK